VPARVLFDWEYHRLGIHVVCVVAIGLLALRQRRMQCRREKEMPRRILSSLLLVSIPCFACSNHATGSFSVNKQLLLARSKKSFLSNDTFCLGLFGDDRKTGGDESVGAKNKKYLGCVVRA
jgi:hypothetical protein